MGRGAQLPTDRVVTVAPGDALTFGAFTLTFIESEHSHPDRIQGVIEHAIAQPAPVRAYKCVETWSVPVEHHKSRHSALVHSSAGFRPGTLDGHRADVVYLAVGQLGHQPRDFIEQYWAETVTAVGARAVILTHWDDFFRPLTKPLRALPYAVDDLDAAMRVLTTCAERDLPHAASSHANHAGAPWMISGIVRGKRRTITTESDPGADRHPDLIDRKWNTPDRPDQWWVADFTYVWTVAGFCYVSFIVDVYSRRILGWRASMSRRSDLVVSALEQAIYTRWRGSFEFTSTGLVHHSDYAEIGLTAIAELSTRPPTSKSTAEKTISDDHWDALEFVSTTRSRSHSSRATRRNSFTRAHGPLLKHSKRAHSPGSRSTTTGRDDIPHWAI